ncbi:MAG: hypothetical protein AAFY85_09125, partial [Pseudomonadota bacterium]
DTFVFDGEFTSTNTVIGFTEGETVLLEDFGFDDVNDAASNFSQSGNDVVFSNSGVSITFEDTALATVLDGLELDG